MENYIFPTGLAVGHSVQCPYSIDAYTKSCLTERDSLAENAPS